MVSMLPNEVLHLVDERKAQLDALRPLNSFTSRSIWASLALDWTYHSNAIDGNRLKLLETKVILEDGIAVGGKTIREHFEAINHCAAIHLVEDLVSRAAEIDTRRIADLHARVMKNIDDQKAGRYRTSGVIIGGASFTPPLDPSAELVEFDRWLSNDSRSLHPIERAAQLHIRFVKIQPFENGNGRTARLLLNWVLMQSGYPVAVIQCGDRMAYFEALDRACTLHDQASFSWMVAEAVSRSIDRYLEVVTGCSPALPDYRWTAYRSGR